MKIERINENQIRCTLTSSDLSARNLNLGELAYGTEKAKKLFHEMIQKASNEVGFEADDIPLMVEAIPLSSESIMLIITKIEDPEELDTRFSRFSPGNEDEPLTALANELLEGADGLLSLFTDNGKNTAASPLTGSDAPSTENAEPGSKLPAARILLSAPSTRSAGQRASQLQSAKHRTRFINTRPMVVTTLLSARQPTAPTHSTACAISCPSTANH